MHLGSTITATGIAILAASFVLLGPFLGSRWRQAGALLLAAFVAMRVVLSVELPVEVFLALAIGAAVGVATLLAFGRPDQHPSAATVVASLASAGITASDLGALTRGRGGSRVVPRHRSTTARSSWSRCAAPPSARPISCSASTGGSG